VGSREDGTPEPDFAMQVERAFDNLKATLDAAGCTFADLVDVTTFHTDPENQFPAIMQVKQTLFLSHRIRTGQPWALPGWRDLILR
jgi:enamine deaminase RidA (YjgF/YER057c/UK114 family)